MIRFLCWAVLAPAYLIAALWAAGAFYFDLPLPTAYREIAALCWTLGAVALPIFLRPRARGLLIAAVGFALILTWWVTIQPRQDRAWRPEVAVLARADIDGDRVTIHNVRNFDYRTEDEFTPRYYTRTYDLRTLRGIDLFIIYWGSDLMAHPILSFDFGDDTHLAFSIETRPEKGEGFSALGGLYRRFELIYIPGDERDLIRLRTNFRKGEDVYLYKLKASPEGVRERFLEYIAQLNELYVHPRWYNALTTNCTTSIRDQHPTAERIPWDWRILLNGKGDELMFERHTIVTAGLPFSELKTRSLINPRAQAAMASLNFSELIRVGLPQPENKSEKTP